MGVFCSARLKSISAIDVMDKKINTIIYLLIKYIFPYRFLTREKLKYIDASGLESSGNT